MLPIFERNFFMFEDSNFMSTPPTDEENMEIIIIIIIIRRRSAIEISSVERNDAE